MISQLTGQVVEKSLNYLVLDNNGVGYKIFVSNNTLDKVNSGESLTIYTYLAVKENALDLYGFINQEEKEIFELLLTVSGIGPKSAITILCSAEADIIRESAYNDDPDYLSKASGIGKKTAEKIVLGLKSKIGSLPSGEKTTGEGTILIEALTSLGYSERESRNALKKIEISDKNDHQSIIKEALKILNKN